jgi:hypothetical protein
LGALVLLLSLPISIAASIVAPVSSEVVIHFLLAIGTLLIGLSVFDFATPRWLSASACAAATILAAIFLAQGLASLTLHDTLSAVAYSRELGAWGETITLAIVMVWFMAVARSLGRGVMMWLGVLSAAVVVGLSTWSVVAGPAGGTPAELRLVLLVPIAWFLCVSARRSVAREQAPGH